MKTKLIIVEGMDNTGKTTLINRLETLLKELGHSVNIVHLTAPPKDVPEDEIESYTRTYYDTIVNNITDPLTYNMYDFIILDRAWYSEYVYGSIYRNRDKLIMAEDNILYDMKVIKNYTVYDAYLIMLYANNNFLQTHDDNKSLSNCSDELLDKERDLFNDTFNMSLLDKKILFCVNDANNEFKDILADVFKYVYIG